ncbi:MAG: hypothetical protein JXD18_12525 [Anaerolineae bacterium]|nr:hypothetical protein [Anaerolineae bacterium]
MTTTNIPQEAHAFGTAPVAEYAPSAKKQRSSLIFSAIFATLGLLGVMIGIVAALWEWDAQLLCVSGGSLFFVAIGAISGFSTLRQRGTRALVFQDGVAYTHGKTTVFRWDDVTAVWQNVTRHYRNGVYTGTTHVYTVQTGDGKKVAFNDVLDNIEGLGLKIQQECTNRLLPLALQAYDRGETLTFGKLGVSKAGMSKGDKDLLPWDEIKGVSLDKGIISIKKEGKWLRWSSVTVPQIPNIFVFTAIVDRVVGINKK